MARSDTRSQGNAPRPWSLGGDAPEPQKVEAPKALTDAERKRLDEKGTLSTHSGTDPLGRAIGPNEDASKRKKVRDSDGKVVTPDKDGLTPKMREARDKVDVPKPVQTAANITADATGTDNANELAIDVARQIAAAQATTGAR